MARKKTKKSAKTGLRPRIGELVRRGLRLLWRVALWSAVAVVIWVLAYPFAMRSRLAPGAELRRSASRS